MATEHKHETVADVLLRRFPVPQEALDEARELARTSGTRLEIVLATRNLVTEAQMALAVAEYLERPAISLAHFSVDEDLLYRVPQRIMTDLNAIPLAVWDQRYAVAMADPFDVMVLEELEKLLDGDVIPYVAPRDQVLRMIEQFRASPVSDRLEDVLKDVGQSGAEIEIAQDAGELTMEDVVPEGDDTPIVRIVNSILIEALHRRVSDIHIEPMAKSLAVRYRIDGVLYDEPSLPRHMQWAVLSRIKILSSLDIAERRLPQDGRFSIHAPGRDVDVRVSVVPTVHGQKTVLRILDKRNLKPSIAALELDPADQDKIVRAIHQPSGLILVTGPTGSGKTTTLYSALQELNKPGVNIVTVEDPVEYQLPRINQIQAHADIGLTFATGLRSILRQDPDIIMVGEIRDHETATIAVQAALTGHLVLSTLHTNDAAGAVARMIHMGVESFLLSSSLIMAQAQRIYRKLCHACKRRREIPWDVLQRQSIDSTLFRDARLYGATGCLHCNRIGYSGRDAIMEILAVDEEIQNLIMRDPNASSVRDAAIRKGMVTLRQSGLQRVCRGTTSLEEILRVTSS